MNSHNDLRDSIRDDERRRRDEVRVSTLQTQIDELRSLVRELSTRQVRNEDHFKNYEASLAEVRSAVEQQRHEAGQASQVRQLEDSRVREQINELDERIDEVNKPIRALQSHVAEVVESIRRSREETQDDDRRYQELRGILEDIAAHAERNSETIKSLRDTIETVRTDSAQVQRDLIKVDDGMRIVEQDARRRVSEVDQSIDVLQSRIDTFKPRFDQLDAIIEDTRESIKHIDPEIESLRAVDESLQVELERVYNTANERDESHGERIDELRVQLDTTARDLRQSIEAYYERLTERVDGHADRFREFGYQLNMVEMRIDELTDADNRIRRELWHLHELRTRLRLDQIQAELDQVVNDRRDVEDAINPARQENSEGSGDSE